MAEEQFKNPTPTVTVDASEGTTTTADIKADGTADIRTQSDSASVDLGAPKGPKEADTDDPNELDIEGNGEGPTGADSAEENPDPDASAEDTSGETGETLPEFDFDSDEVVSKYDAKYTTKDEAGDTVINLNAFNEEVQANYKDGKTDLNPGSRAYLKKVFGISDQMIDRHLSGLVADAEKQDAAYYEKFGGGDAYSEAIEWSKGEGGYSKAQAEKYNAALVKYQKTGDRSDLDDQIDLLASRWKSATGKGTTATPSKGKTFRDRRPSSPERQANKTAVNAAGPKLFANSEEHRLAQAEAQASGDPKKMKEVSDRLRSSMRQPNWH